MDKMDSSSSQLIDNYEHTDEFVFYTATSIPGKECDLNLFDCEISSRCSCADGCSNASICECLRNSGGTVNYVDGRLVDAEGTMHSCTDGTGGGADGYLVECGTRCKCSPSECANRLVQFGPTAGLQVEPVAGKGYGLIAGKGLRKGQFVCEYAGEVVGDAEAARRRATDHGANYIFTLNEFAANRRLRTNIDATCIANIGRYVNHSCNPNCAVVPVRVDALVPRLCIFARQDVGAGEEITYRYADAGNRMENVVDFCKLKACLCGSNDCVKYLPFGS